MPLYTRKPLAIARQRSRAVYRPAGWPVLDSTSMTNQESEECSRKRSRLSIVQSSSGCWAASHGAPTELVWVVRGMQQRPANLTVVKTQVGVIAASIPGPRLQGG